MCSFFASNMPQITDMMSSSASTVAAAALFFHRFYMFQSFQEFDRVVRAVNPTSTHSSVTENGTVLSFISMQDSRPHA